MTRLRIIAGTFRGRRIDAPPGSRTRPTTDRVRESLFSIIGDLHNLRVWDAFAGSGALGFEALSRGASSVIFTDTDRNALRTLHANAATLDVADQVEIRRASFFDTVGSFTHDDAAPDLVFLDPPYAAPFHDKILDQLACDNTILPGTRFVFECSSHDVISIPDAFSDVDRRRYGSTILNFFTKSF